MAWLEIRPKGKQSYRIAIEQGTVRVGRATSNDLSLSDDPATSRFHAEITYGKDACVVKDLGSHNGTFVRGQRITKPTPVGPGMWIGVGSTKIRLVTGAEAKSDAVTSPGPALEEGKSVILSAADIMHSAQSAGEPAVETPASEDASPQIRAFATLSRAADQLLAQRPLDEVLELAIDMAFEVASPDRAAVMLKDGDPPVLRPAASRGMSVGGDQLPISRTIVDLVLNRQQSVMTSDARLDERFTDAESIILQNIRSAMCVPLWNNKEVIGLIYVDKQRQLQSFSKIDLEALTLLANVAAVKIDNVRLFLKEQKMKEIERELQAAARIQRRLLPAEPPSVPGYELLGHNEPCLDVGGDYFDYMFRGLGRLSIAIGDVSGKGMGAALLMATLQASFHAHASTDASVSELVSRLNRAVCANSAADKFITFFYGELDVDRGMLCYCNAGHNPPLLFRAGTTEVERLGSGGLILGFDPEVRYETREVHLGPDDLVVTFSDGVTESANTAGDEFGEARLIEAVQACQTEPVTTVRERIDAEVASFVGKAEQFDDYTLMLLKRASGS